MIYFELIFVCGVGYASALLPSLPVSLQTFWKYHLFKMLYFLMEFFGHLFCESVSPARGQFILWMACFTSAPAPLMLVVL